MTEQRLAQLEEAVTFSEWDKYGSDLSVHWIQNGPSFQPIRWDGNHWVRVSEDAT